MSDPYQSYVSLLLHCDGSNNSTTFIDEMDRVLTLYGNPTMSTTQFKKGTSSGYFNGGSAILVEQHSSLSIGTDDFTVDFWVWTDPNISTWSRIAENEAYNVTGGWHFSYNGYDSAGTRRLGFQLGLNGGGGARIDSNSAIPTSQWVHIAVVRTGSTIAMYVNGAKQTATITTSENFTSQKLILGATLGYTNFFTGYLDEFRVTKGISRYTENFNVWYDDYYQDWVSLLLHCDGSNNSTSFIDETGKPVTANGNAKTSTDQYKFGNASAYFDGTGDYLQIPYSSAFDFGSGDFTVESWIWINGNSIPDFDGLRGGAIINTWASAGQIKGWQLTILGSSSTTGTGIAFDSWNNDNSNLYRATVNISQGVWHHVAATVQSGVRRIFLDGVLLSRINYYGWIRIFRIQCFQ